MDKRKEEAKGHIETAFGYLRRIPVTDMAVDYMAVARQELRAACAALESKEEQQMAASKQEPEA